MLATLANIEDEAMLERSGPALGGLVGSCLIDLIRLVAASVEVSRMSISAIAILVVNVAASILRNSF